MKRYYIHIKQTPQTLRDALVKHLSLSAVQAEKLIFQGSVWQVKPEKRLKNADQVFIDELVRVNIPMYPVKECVVTDDAIAYQDKYVLIVYKQANVPVHPTPYSDIDSLSYAVGRLMGDTAGGYQSSAINRLDKPTQGLVFFAKDKETERRLHAMFREHQMKKRYIAVTASCEDLQSSYIIRDDVTWNGKTKTAATYVRHLKDKNGLSYFLVFPQTGRTHQIRQHFQKRIAPLVGDKKYGTGSSDDEMGLICFEYRFVHPRTGKMIRVRRMPEELKMLLYNK